MQNAKFFAITLPDVAMCDIGISYWRRALLQWTCLRDRTFENQRYRASGLNLVVLAIILWNTIYLERAINSGSELESQFQRPEMGAAVRRRINEFCRVVEAC
jgi:hypothetical protein